MVRRVPIRVGIIRHVQNGVDVQPQLCAMARRGGPCPKYLEVLVLHQSPDSNRMCKFIRSQIEAETEMNIETIEDLSRMLKTGKLKLGDNWEETGITFGGASADGGADSQVEDPRERLTRTRETMSTRYLVGAIAR